MIKNLDKANIPMANLLQIKEEQGLRFYKDCIHKTNQFSTKYILQKFLREHQDHIEKLKNELQDTAEKSLAKQFLKQLAKSDPPQELCKEYDLSTLTLVEATKLAIRLAENDIDFYGHLLEQKLKIVSRQALEKIISEKASFVKQLKSEYNKILYGSKMKI